jgi:hypothetical protein
MCDKSEMKRWPHRGKQKRKSTKGLPLAEKIGNKSSGLASFANRRMPKFDPPVTLNHRGSPLENLQSTENVNDYPMNDGVRWSGRMTKDLSISPKEEIRRDKGE